MLNECLKMFKNVKMFNVIRMLQNVKRMLINV